MKSPFLFVMVLVVCLPSLSHAGFCSPFTSKTENIIQFCGGQYFDGNDLHLDTFEASTRKTICDCSFKIKNSTIITLSTKTNPVQTSTECDITSTRIEFKIAENTSINGIICDYAAKSLDIRSGQTLQITFYNELVNLEKYCLNLDTTAESQTFEGMCYSDGFTTTELSTHSSKENKVTVDEKEQEAYTSGTRKDQNKDSTTTSYTSTGYLSTSNAITTMNDLETSSIYGIPMKILLPSVGGGLLFLIVVIIVVLFIQRKKNYREKLKNKTVKRNSDNGDEMVYNELYHSFGNGGHVTAGAGAGTGTGGFNHGIEMDTRGVGEYAEVSVQHTTTDKTINSDETIFDGDKNKNCGLAYTDTTKKHDDRPEAVYAMPNKDRKNEKEQDDTTPVYAVPEKKKDR